MAETRTPQVGDTVLLEGLARVITEIRGRSVHFDNPPSFERATFERDENGNKIRVSGHPSRAGAVGMGSLDLIVSEPAVLWGVRGRVEAKGANPDAVTLEPAEHQINQ